MENTLRDSLIVDWSTKGLSVVKIVEKLATKDIRCATKTVAKVLKNKGFVYDKKNHSWHKPERTEERIVYNRSTVEPIEKMEIEQNNYISNRDTGLVEFSGLSPIEFNTLKTMIAERLEGKKQVGSKLIEEVAKLKVRERKNKSYYISIELSDQVAQLAEKNNIKISNAVEVALIDFIKQYNS